MGREWAADVSVLQDKALPTRCTPKNWSKTAVLVVIAVLVGVVRGDLEADALLNVSYVGSAAIHCHDGTDPACVPSLRVTPAAAARTGAVWAREAVPLDEAWEATLTVRMAAGASTACPALDESQPTCVQRGGHGMAVVVQDAAADPLTVIGDGGNGVGYAGIAGAAAVEFDTWFDAALDDLHDNHVGVQAGGPGVPLTAAHADGLGFSAELPDLGDGEAHRLRVAYAPVLDRGVLHPELCAATGSCGRLQSTEALASLLAAGMGDSAPLGSLHVYVDGAAEAVLVAAVGLRWAVPRSSARAGVTLGVTASTGDAQWQTHDVESWEICRAGVCRAVFQPS